MATKDIIASAVAAFLALTSQSVLAGEKSTDSSEKCYGLVKAGKNDCATATASCAGSATKNSQPDAYVFMPKGLCEKLVGGMTKPAQKSKK